MARGPREAMGADTGAAMVHQVSLHERLDAARATAEQRNEADERGMAVVTTGAASLARSLFRCSADVRDQTMEYIFDWLQRRDYPRSSDGLSLLGMPSYQASRRLRCST
jgi:hypothetical protein